MTWAIFVLVDNHYLGLAVRWPMAVNNDHPWPV